MKKGVRITGLVLIAGLIYNALPAQHYRITVDKEAEAKRKTALNQLDILFKAHAYDSVISYCAKARKENLLDYSVLELALATASWYKGDRSTAYLYVQNDVDYNLKLNGGGGSPFSMLYDYQFGPALATDTFLERLITVKVSDYYRSLEYYPERNAGLRIMLLDHQRQRAKNRFEYEEQQATSKEQRDRLKQQLQQDNEDWATPFLQLLRDNQGLFTRRAIGPAAEKQVAMIASFDKPAYFDACRPLLQQALQSGEVQADGYVYILVAESKLAKPGKQDEDRLRDSLCRVYRCKDVIYDSTGRGYSYYTGEYVTMKSDTIYYRDGNDSTRRIIMRPVLPR